MQCDMFCEDSILFPGIGYLPDFGDTGPTVHKFLRRIKLISSFFKGNIIFLVNVRMSLLYHLKKGRETLNLTFQIFLL